MSESQISGSTDGSAAETVSEAFSAPEGKRIFLGAPSLLALANGKLLLAVDQMGPDVKGLSGKKGHNVRRNRWMQGCVMSSADGGETWKRVATFPFRRASLFRDGGDVYLLGEASGGLCLMRSPDGGASWSSSMELTGDLDLWLSPTSIVAAGDDWLIPCLIPSEGGMGLAVWRAPRGASLMNRKAWTQGPVSPPLSNWISRGSGMDCGIPQGGMAPAWHDPLLIRITDSQHPWYAEEMWHLFGATRSGRQHWTSLMRLNTRDLVLSVQPTPAGEPWIWVPCPGGHEKFALFFDASSRLFWLMGSQGAEGCPLGREVAQEAGLHQVGLWSSGNLQDWRFVSTVVSGESGPSGIRCDPAIAICGNDLVWVCRAGGGRSRNARETVRILCGRIKNFRSNHA